MRKKKKDICNIPSQLQRRSRKAFLQKSLREARRPLLRGPLSTRVVQKSPHNPPHSLLQTALPSPTVCCRLPSTPLTVCCRLPSPPPRSVTDCFPFFGGILNVFMAWPPPFQPNGSRPRGRDAAVYRLAVPPSTCSPANCIPATTPSSSRRQDPCRWARFRGGVTRPGGLYPTPAHACF